jgi:hypothetical protein
MELNQNLFQLIHLGFPTISHCLANSVANLLYHWLNNFILNTSSLIILPQQINGIIFKAILSGNTVSSISFSKLV